MSQGDEATMGSSMFSLSQSQRMAMSSVLRSKMREGEEYLNATRGREEAIRQAANSAMVGSLPSPLPHISSPHLLSSGIMASSSQGGSVRALPHSPIHRPWTTASGQSLEVGDSSSFLPALPVPAVLPAAKYALSPLPVTEQQKILNLGREEMEEEMRSMAEKHSRYQTALGAIHRAAVGGTAMPKIEKGGLAPPRFAKVGSSAAQSTGKEKESSRPSSTSSRARASKAPSIPGVFRGTAHLDEVLMKKESSERAMLRSFYQQLLLKYLHRR